MGVFIKRYIFNSFITSKKLGKREIKVIDRHVRQQVKINKKTVDKVSP